MKLSPQGLPIIDFAQAANAESTFALIEVAKQVATAIETVGCFYVKNHGVSSSLIDETFADFKDYFAQPREYKTKHVNPDDHERGYIPFETQNINAFMGKTDRPNDPVERMIFGPTYECNPPVPENVWPDTPTTLRTNGIDYYESFRKLADTIMDVFSLAVSAPEEDYFYSRGHDGLHKMKANFYPGVSNPKPMQMNRFAEHTDANLFTILATDECRGALLIEKTNGEWVYGDPVPGCLLVLVGVGLERVTNAKWKATLHKVVWPDGDRIPDRLAVAYFVAMNPQAIMECIETCIAPGDRPKYEPKTYSQYQASYTSRFTFRHA